MERDIIRNGLCDDNGDIVGGDSMTQFNLATWLLSKQTKIQFTCAANDVPEQCLRLIK